MEDGFLARNLLVYMENAFIKGIQELSWQ